MDEIKGPQLDMATPIDFIRAIAAFGNNQKLYYQMLKQLDLAPQMQ
jgi:hypothetical protein